ncbi:hypothetical protein EYF80_001795 [Liparis tanakae]|uniref:Uncharacterized protein n=1 Tax=Liparis tanakae TaxID=230148 RepID=A0A4Z2JCT9_9TELE|nr:hypothetical protein EYF80_001795 [Liparis tanakae]
MDSSVLPSPPHRTARCSPCWSSPLSTSPVVCDSRPCCLEGLEEELTHVPDPSDTTNASKTIKDKSPMGLKQLEELGKFGPTDLKSQLWFHNPCLVEDGSMEDVSHHHGLIARPPHPPGAGMNGGKHCSSELLRSCRAGLAVPPSCKVRHWALSMKQNGSPIELHCPLTGLRGTAALTVTVVASSHPRSEEDWSSSSLLGVSDMAFSLAWSGCEGVLVCPALASVKAKANRKATNYLGFPWRLANRGPRGPAPPCRLYAFPARPLHMSQLRWGQIDLAQKRNKHDVLNLQRATREKGHRLRQTIDSMHAMSCSTEGITKQGCRAVAPPVGRMSQRALGLQDARVLFLCVDHTLNNRSTRSARVTYSFVGWQKQARRCIVILIFLEPPQTEADMSKVTDKMIIDADKIETRRNREDCGDKVEEADGDKGGKHRDRLNPSNFWGAAEDQQAADLDLIHSHALTALFLRLLGERVESQGRHHVSTHHMSMLGEDRVRAAYDTASGWPFHIQQSRPVNCDTFLKAATLNEANQGELRGAAERLVCFHQHLVWCQGEAGCTPGILPQQGNQTCCSPAQREDHRGEHMEWSRGSKNNRSQMKDQRFPAKEHGG